MLKRIVWGWIKPALKVWLRDRALRLNGGRVKQLAAKLNVPVEVVVAVNDAVIEEGLAQLDQFKP